MSGAIGRIRGATPRQVPLIVVAPAGDVEARIAFLEAGADDVIAGELRVAPARPASGVSFIRTGKARPEGVAGTGAGTIVTFFSPKGGSAPRRWR